MLGALLVQVRLELRFHARHDGHRTLAALDEMETIFRDFAGRRIAPTASYLATANPKLLLNQGGASPTTTSDGAPGFRLRGVRKGTLADLLGLKNGDVITEVYGPPAARRTIITGFLVDSTGGFAVAFAVAAGVALLGMAGWGLIIPRIAMVGWSRPAA